ncbi:hypothetical protein VTO73DRAFT_9569 [Trametes versicolor]
MTLLRAELQTVMNSHFGEAVGDSDAAPSYVIEDYAEFTVIGCGYKIEGWPSSIPFRNASEIRGGCAVLSKLLKLWKEKKIKFVPATQLDKLTRNAALDPTLVAPTPGFLHRKPDGGQDDIGRLRYRWKTKPDGGSLRHPKDGPKSDKFIYNSNDEGPGPASLQTRTPTPRPLQWQPLPLMPPLTLAPGSLASLSYDGRYNTGSDQDPEEISEFLSEDERDSEMEMSSEVEA